LVVWLFGCLVVWLFGCLVVWLFGCLVVWLFGCLVVWLFGCLTSYLLETQTENGRRQAGTPATAHPGVRGAASRVDDEAADLQGELVLSCMLPVKHTKPVKPVKPTYQPTNLPTYQPNKTIQSKTNQIKPTNQTKQSKLANMHSSQPG
jgi:hypothetical protein